MMLIFKELMLGNNLLKKYPPPKKKSKPNLRLQNKSALDPDLRNYAVSLSSFLYNHRILYLNHKEI